MIKLVLVNESFTNPIFYRRWELLAEKHRDWDITLLAPRKESFKATKGSFGRDVTIQGQIIDNNNFHIRVFDKKYLMGLGWISPDFKNILSEIAPDVIYNIGAHNQISLLQLMRLRNRYLPKAKLLSFSMRGPNYNISHFKEKCSPLSRYIKRRLYYVYVKSALDYFNKNCDAVFCHYPDAMKCFRDEGYKGPIYMQTQVGVNPELFHYDEKKRTEIRQKYEIDDSTFVFGSATRFTPDKGLYEILKALPVEGNWKYLMMGSGTKEEEQKLRELIQARGLGDKIILTGFVQLKDMPKYWNAIDCMLHVPITTFSWVETFSIALVQGMITGKPVIGSNSGSVPYQIGEEGIIIPEKDVDALHEKIVWVLSHQDEAKTIGERMRSRAENCFSVFHLNDMFYETVMEDVLQGKYDEKKIDMARYRTKEERTHEEKKNQ